MLREIVNSDGARVYWVRLEGISSLVREATVAAEDDGFYGHCGVDFGALIRTGWQNISSFRVRSGASTLTMQLASLVYGRSRSLFGKMKQVYNALRIERAFSKNQILEQYLNRAFYGSGAIGIEAASREYFGKPNCHLSLAEAAFLAGLPKSPTDLNPRKGLEGAKKRQGYVLRRMLKTGKITQTDFDRALAEKIILRKSKHKMAAMHFTDYVLSLSPGSGDIHTTLDLDLEEQVERLVREHVKALKGGGLTNAAVVVLDNSDGSILAMAGSADYWSGADGMVNGALAKRQPGSALKPFTYACSFERNFSPVSVVGDIETQYLGQGGALYMPRNYSERYMGPVLIREALGRSLNIPAVRIANAVGPETILKRLQAAGFESLDKSAKHYGLGLTLGNGEVTLLELAQAYAMFARNGVPIKALSIKRSLSKSSCGVQGRFFQEEPLAAGGIFSRAVCFLITDILSDEGIRGRAFGISNPLMLDFPMAIKTGTSSNWRDNWVVGYTKEFTVAVWTGDFGGRSMNRLSGTIGAGPLFRGVAHLVAKHMGPTFQPTLPKPCEGVERIIACAFSGKAPTAYCKNCCTAYVLKREGGGVRETCDMHRLVRLDKRNGLLASGKCPSRYVMDRVYEVLPQEYAEWQESHHMVVPPVRYSPLCLPDSVAVDALVITRPRAGEVFLLEPGYARELQTLEFRGEVNPVLAKVFWEVDGKRVGASGWPYRADWVLEKGRHRLVMVARGKRSDPVEFEVR